MSPKKQRVDDPKPQFLGWLSHNPCFNMGNVWTLQWRQTTWHFQWCFCVCVAKTPWDLTCHAPSVWFFICRYLSTFQSTSKIYPSLDVNLGANQQALSGKCISAGRTSTTTSKLASTIKRCLMRIAGTEMFPLCFQLTLLWNTSAWGSLQSWAHQQRQDSISTC